MTSKLRFIGLSIFCSSAALVTILLGLNNLPKSVGAAPGEKLEPQVQRELEQMKKRVATPLPEMRGRSKLNTANPKLRMSKNAYGKWEFMSPSQLKSIRQKTPRGPIIDKNKIDTYVIKKQIKVLVADFSGTGDVVNLILNGDYYPDIELDASYQIFDMNLARGFNTIIIQGVQRATPFDYITAELTLLGSQLLPGEENGPFQLLLRPNQSAALDNIAFPQIGISRSKYPETVLHITEAWKGFQPAYRPAIPANSPRLLTLDRTNTARVDARRNYNLAPPVPKRCPTVQTNPDTGETIRDQRDEYPPAAFLESADPVDRTRRANVKCIAGWDNRDSGSDFGRQINGYIPRTGQPRIKIADDSVVEFVVSP